MTGLDDFGVKGRGDPSHDRPWWPGCHPLERRGSQGTAVGLQRYFLPKPPEAGDGRDRF